MTVFSKSLAGALILGSAAFLPSLASAQPLAVTVNPLAIPGQILGAPFAIFEPPAPNVYNPFPAYEAAVSFTSDGRAVVAEPVLRATGPRFDNPANGVRPVVLRRGSVVPPYVNTAPARNVSDRRLVPNGEYEFFISPEQKIVFVDPATRRVARIVR